MSIRKLKSTQYCTINTVMPLSLKSQIGKLMLTNRRVGKGYQFTVPSPNSYPYQWLWDSCFHAIILSYIDVSAAKEELLTLVKKQFGNGMIPHMIYWERAPLSTFPHIAWGKRSTSSITQPPMLAYSVWKVYQKDKDKEFLMKMYPAMKSFYDFFFKERDHKGHRLIGIINPDESGEDNSPRFDKALHLPSVHTIDVNYAKRLALIERNRVCEFSIDCMDNFYWVRDASFNSILLRNLRILSEIAQELDNNKDAVKYNLLAQEVSAAMRKFMLRPDGVMFSTYGLNYRKIETLTWAIFMPMFANVLTPDEAQDLVENHLLNKKEFASTYSVPTVALSEPSYSADGFWRGPVWTASNWFIYHGLKNYGFDKEANMIIASTERLINKSGFREYYNPSSGEGYGAHDFTWGGLLLDMQADLG